MTDKAKLKEYLASLRFELRYWKRIVKKDGILNGAYARGQVSALTFAIAQFKYWQTIPVLKEVKR